MLNCFVYEEVAVLCIQSKQSCSSFIASRPSTRAVVARKPQKGEWLIESGAQRGEGYARVTRRAAETKFSEILHGIEFFEQMVGE